MFQTPHKDPKYWPVPLGAGVLVEIQFGKVETTSIELLNGGIRNLTTAHVRAASPKILDSIVDEILPGGNGSIGKQFIISEPNLRYLQKSEYEACGFQVPDPENNELGDLAFINYERIIALMEPSEQLPFTPMGGRVFFEFDLDDESSKLHQVGDAGLVMEEKHLAVENQLATVTGVGPRVENVEVGDRVFVRRSAAAIIVEGERYFFANSEDEIFARLR